VVLVATLVAAVTVVPVVPVVLVATLVAVLVATPPVARAVLVVNGSSQHAAV